MVACHVVTQPELALTSVGAPWRRCHGRGRREREHAARGAQRHQDRSAAACSARRRRSRSTTSPSVSRPSRRRSPRSSARAAAARRPWRACCSAWCSRPAARCSTAARICARSSRRERRDVPARRAGDLPGPVRGLQPVLPGRSRARDADQEVRAGAVAGTESASVMIEALNAVGLRPEETLGRYPHQLSGGQRQRIMVARALLLKPRLIIADEPVSMVDASLRATILDSLRTLNQRVRHLAHLHHPRPDDRLPDQPEHHRALPRHGGRGWRRRAGRQAAQTPLHAAAGRIDPAARSRSALAPGAACGGDRRAERIGTLVGCKFVDRCPHVMPMCHESPPPLFQIDPAQAATCYLYRDNGTIALEQMGDVFVGARSPLGLAAACLRVARCRSGPQREGSQRPPAAAPGPGPEWVKVMAARRHKTLVVGHPCHTDIHTGRPRCRVVT